MEGSLTATNNCVFTGTNNMLLDIILRCARLPYKPVGIDLPIGQVAGFRKIMCSDLNIKTSTDIVYMNVHMTYSIFSNRAPGGQLFQPFRKEGL